jgi:hypothetical protein
MRGSLGDTLATSTVTSSGPPGDGNVIILSDSSQEEEVHEEDATDVEAAPSSAGGISASTADATDANKALLALIKHQFHVPTCRVNI